MGSVSDTCAHRFIYTYKALFPAQGRKQDVAIRKVKWQSSPGVHSHAAVVPVTLSWKCHLLNLEILDYKESFITEFEIYLYNQMLMLFH